MENNAQCLATSRTARILALLLLFMLPAPVQAQFNYTVTSGAITITKYTGSDRLVTISNTMYVNGWGYLPVICIGDQAFSGCESMTNVTIGTNVTSIGYETFDDCISLKSIAIPNSVTNIGDYAFGQ
jgi:hypothetical protein